MLSLKVEADVLREAADRLRARRLALGWRQTDLAERSGVAIATLRRFERTGRIGFEGLARMLVTLGLADSLLQALKPPAASPPSIEAFLAAAPSHQPRQRARRSASTP